MSSAAKTSLVLVGVVMLFLGLAGLMLLQVWGRPPQPSPLSPADPKFTNTAPVRLSAAELIRSGGDTSGLDCYACHERNKPPQVKLDANNKVVLPKEHEDLGMRHGRNDRNHNCFNCHDPENLDQLKTRDGKRYKWEESTKLCASCHGPTYRDWEIGIHGRVSGYWSAQAGAKTRLECASCHHPHAPAFPSVKPAPGPHLLHPNPAVNTEKKD